MRFNYAKKFGCNFGINNGINNGKYIIYNYSNYIIN